MTPILLKAATGTTDWYAYYFDQSLADYVADKVLFEEQLAPNLGKYDATVDETKGTHILLFSGATQPASWDDAVVGVSWDLSVAAIKAKTDLIGTLNSETRW